MFFCSVMVSDRLCLSSLPTHTLQSLSASSRSFTLSILLFCILCLSRFLSLSLTLTLSLSLCAACSLSLTSEFAAYTYSPGMVSQPFFTTVECDAVAVFVFRVHSLLNNTKIIAIVHQPKSTHRLSTA